MHVLLDENDTKMYMHVYTYLHTLSIFCVQTYIHTYIQGAYLASWLNLSGSAFIHVLHVLCIHTHTHTHIHTGRIPGKLAKSEWKRHMIETKGITRENIRFYDDKPAGSDVVGYVPAVRFIHVCMYTCTYVRMLIEILDFTMTSLQAQTLLDMFLR
jgi:hypothetical protein